MIRSADFHTVVANSRALELSNMTADTPNPPNGIIERLPGSQEPSGVLQDDAWHDLAGPPPLTPEQSVEAGRASLKLLREAGITTFQEASANPATDTIYKTIKAEGGLSPPRPAANPPASRINPPTSPHP